MGDVKNCETEPEARGCSQLQVGYSLVDWEQQIIMLKTTSKLVEN